VTPRPRRTPAEWATLLGSAGLVLVVVVLILAQVPGDDRPAEPVARVGRVRQVGDAFQVDVTVANAGDRTAAQVQVTAGLTLGDTTSTAEQTIDFLSGGEDEQVVFIFDDDPASGDLRVAVTGYAVP